MHHTSLVSAVFDSHAEAERAVSELRRAGARDSALSVVAGRGNVDLADGDDDHSNILRGILGGGALGSGLAVAALAIPGVGPLAAAGAIAASAVPGALGIGAAVGAVGGSINEALKGHGVDDEDAAYYDERIRGGGVFVSVDTEKAGIGATEAAEILYGAGGHSARRARAGTVA